MLGDQVQNLYKIDWNAVERLTLGYLVIFDTVDGGGNDCTSAGDRCVCHPIVEDEKAGGCVCELLLAIWNVQSRVGEVDTMPGLFHLDLASK